MKVLLLGTSTTEPDYQAWQAALKREGVPFDSIVGPTSSRTAITASTLSDTLPDGTPEGKYQAIIESIGGLTDCSTGTCVSDLSSAESSAIETYEQDFAVRQITGDVYPGASYGMNIPATSGALDGATGALTSDGLKTFPYLKGPVPMDTGTYGYEATPVSTTNFDTLVTGPNNSSLVGIYTHPDGVQEMVETFNQNQYQIQAELLRHGAIAWATRGVYFGDQRNYLEANVDDNFLSDDSWSISGNATTAAHSTDYNPADALREVPADVAAAAQWSKANNFRIDMLFNGGGSVAVASGDSLVGSGDSGSGTTGSTGTSGGTATGTDPLLAAFQGNDPATGKPYTQDFGWISHTWDHPNIDEGCATQDYIEAELNQNTTWGATAASNGNPTAGGLGLTQSTDPSDALGNENPNVIITGEHSGLPNLLPGNPGQVDPPGLDSADAATTTGAGLPAGEYVYAISDQFNTAAPGATPVAGTGESAGSVSAPVTVTSPNNSVTLSWSAVCHAADYKIYRAPYTPPPAGSPTGTAGTIGTWSVIQTVPANTSTDFTNPTGNSTTNTAGGGAIVKTYTDNGATGTAGSPQTAGNADESAYEQNPVLDAAFAGTLDGGIKYFGADASKPYPNPADGSFATGAFGGAATEYQAGATFQDAGATGIPRYPTNIYYNVSTNAQEVDEYQTLYDSPTCVPITGVTTCNPAGTAFTITQIVANVDQGMFQHMMGNDPRPHYFHQTNLMSQTTGSPNGEGDGLFYETLNPLLAEYNGYFASNAPIEQPTMAQIGTLLTQQANWATASTSQVSGYIQGNQVTVTNSGTGAIETPLTGITTVGSSYGGSQSGWTSENPGSTTYTAQTTWPAPRAVTVALSPPSISADGTSTSTATATVTADDNFPIVGDSLAFTSSDSAVKVGSVTNNNDGTYTATLTSSKTQGQVTVTATDSTVSPNTVTGQATLTQTPVTTTTTTTTTSSSPTTTTTTPPPPPPPAKRPSNSRLPVIGGSPVVGYTLSASTGTWSGTAPISYAYQWQRCKPRCANIAGATRSSYRLGNADKGAKLQVIVTARNRVGSARVISGQVGPVLSTSQAKARLMSGLAVRGKAGRIGALLKSGGYALSFSSPGSGRLVISWVSGSKSKRLVVATVTVSLQGTRAKTVKIVLTPKGRQSLKRVKHLTVTAQGTLSLVGGSPIRANRTFTLNR
ncbi:MAG: hypothetical protein JO372_02275 [Solirubrobacterales bacterium]|nr:hypothetical protein [Solirubrobacterales bacterium]